MSNQNNTNKKMEELAKTLVEKNKSYKDISSEYFKKNSEENINIENNKEKDDKEETKKDKIYIMKIINEKNVEKYKHKEKSKIKNKNLENTSKNRTKDDLKLCTTVNKSLTDYYYCCKKNNTRVNSLVEEEKEKNNNESSLILNNTNNKENENINNINNNIDNDNLYLIKFIGNDLDLNLDDYNFIKILKIYKCLMNNINNNINDIIDIIQILSQEYIKFIFEGKINIFIYKFNYSIDIIKFIFYQIFIFLNLLFLDEIKNISDNGFEMTFKSLLSYSSQNFELILKITSNPNLYTNQEIKITKSFAGKNKIIFSILKTLSPKKNNFKLILNIFNKEQNNFKEDEYKNILKSSFKLIDEIENETKLSRTKEIRNNVYNKLDKFIINLKTKEFILNKIKIIQQKQINDDNINIDNLLSEINVEEDMNNNTNKKDNQNFFSLPTSEREDEEKAEFKYTLFIELDETLVHYYEEGENYFVKVRQGTDDFLKTLHDFCEIIIISTSSKEYTDIILENLNKEKKYVDNAIYKDLCDGNNSVINFEKINRDNKKCIFICHNKKDFFNAPENNIIELKEFNGEEEDKEIVWLKEELIKLKNNINDDINNIIININDIIVNNRNEENNNKK